MRWLCFLLACLFLLVHAAEVPAQPKKKNPHIADTDPLSPEEQVKKFHLPPGFVIELVAAEPRVKKPININFDAKGRLWVTGSEEYPFAAPLDKPGKDTVKILEDFAPNGLARKVTTFADGLNIPIGILPTAKGALVYSIPHIYHMTDNDGDGVADKRDILYSTYGFKDTHGMTGEFMWGFDGWVYCCHGFANSSTVKSKSDAITMQSGNTYRIKPDGSRIEYFTHGQVNPFGLAFDPLGNLYSADCHTRPIYQLLKGAFYPSFGKPHDGIGFGPEMVTHDHGSTAIAGIAYYAATQFPAEYRDNIFIGNVVTNRINRDRLDRKGATYRGVAMPDFVKCDDPWFRPVDIKLGPDGALYVADFYNRIIGHYEVPLNHPLRDRERGRVWRIVYRGENARPQAMRDLTKATHGELIDALADDNLTVRTHATNQLVLAGESVADAVQAGFAKAGAVQQAHSLWVLERLGKLSDTLLAQAAQSKDAIVRVHAMRVLGERTRLAAEQRPLIFAALKDSDAFVQRTAAEALGTHRAAENLAPLIECRHAVPAEDTHLLHAVRMALRDQLRAPEVWAKMSASWTEKDSRVLADVCPGAHNVESATFLADHLGHYSESPATWNRFAHYYARHGKDGTASRILELSRQKLPAAAQGAVVKSVQQGLQEAGRALGQTERAWAEKHALKLLASAEADQQQTGIEIAGSLKLAPAQTALLELATNAKNKDAQRKNAVAALFAIEPLKYVGVFEPLLTDAKQSIEFREEVAASLAGTNLPEAQGVLIKILQAAPARLQTGIAAALASSPVGGEKLLLAVKEGKASGRLLQDKGIEFRLRIAKLPDLDQRLAELTKGLPAADQRFLDLVNQRRGGFDAVKADVGLGLKAFEKHCAACHQLANKGAKIGPQLDGIGIRGLDRLLEDILDPSRNVDQAFRATTLVLNNGQLVTGLLLRQEGQVFVMADNQGKEVRVPSTMIQERLVAQLSPMPANLVEQIPEQDFYHLLAYLLQQRVK